MPNPPSNPQEIAGAGERIFREKYQERAEKQHTGKFLAINVGTEEAFLGHVPEEALQRARDCFTWYESDLLGLLGSECLSRPTLDVPRLNTRKHV